MTWWQRLTFRLDKQGRRCFQSLPLGRSLGLGQLESACDELHFLRKWNRMMEISDKTNWIIMPKSQQSALNLTTLYTHDCQSSPSKSLNPNNLQHSVQFRNSANPGSKLPLLDRRVPDPLGPLETTFGLLCPISGLADADPELLWNRTGGNFLFLQRGQISCQKCSQTAAWHPEWVSSTYSFIQQQLTSISAMQDGNSKRGELLIWGDALTGASAWVEYRHEKMGIF